MKRISITIILLVSIVTAAVSVFGEGGWQEYRAQHFIIYYKEAPVDFVEAVEEAAERYYEEITENLGFTRYEGWSFDRRAHIYICDNKEDYIQTAQQAGWSHGVAYLRKKTIITFPSAHGFFDSTLPHELGHIIFREFVGFNSVLPLWLDEGIAMYQERAKRWGANKTVKEAIENGTFIPIPKLSQMALYRDTPQETVDLFYAEAASIVYFLIKDQGEYRFVRFCKKMKRGEPFLPALTSVYVRFDDLEDLNRAWMRYLEE